MRSASSITEGGASRERCYLGYRREKGRSVARGKNLLGNGANLGDREKKCWPARKNLWEGLLGFWCEPVQSQQLGREKVSKKSKRSTTQRMRERSYAEGGKKGYIGKSGRRGFG